MNTNNWAYLDAPTGVAGDMLLAALFDQGLPEEVVLEPLKSFGLGAAFRLQICKSSSAGMRGTRLNVELLEAMEQQSISIAKAVRPSTHSVRAWLAGQTGALGCARAKSSPRAALPFLRSSAATPAHKRTTHA